MSKGLGKKIVIQFTGELIGDVSENTNAFKVTGMERKHVNGELINGDYRIDRLERYPILVVWDGSPFAGGPDGVEITPEGLILGGEE